MDKWYSLFDKIYQKENLAEAFKQVKRNHGAPGVDGVTVKKYESKLSENLELIQMELKTKTYTPSPVRRVMIDKPDGGKRPLGIPTVKDRVVQQAVVNKMNPIFEEGVHPSSYGYRKGRSQAQAVEKATQFARKYQFRFAVDMDLSKCFDRLDHEFLINEVAEKISDGSVLWLIRTFLKSGVLEDGVAPHLLATRFGSCNCKIPTGRCDLDLVIQLLIKVQFDIINPNRPTGPRRNIYE